MIIFIFNMWSLSIVTLFMIHYIYWNINSYHYMYNFSYTFKPCFITISVICLLSPIYLLISSRKHDDNLLLTKKIIDKMKTLNKSDELYKSHTCVICNDKHEYNVLVKSKCGHVYSKECLMLGINKMYPMCALCRKKIE